MREYIDGRVKAVFSALMLIGFGGLVYLIFRPDSWVAETVKKRLGIILFSPEFLNHIPDPLYLFGRNYLADILWAGSLTLLVYAVLLNDGIGITFIVCILFETFIELLQLGNWLRGVFDVMDILAEISASGVMIYTIIYFNSKKEKRYVEKKSGSN